ncbi:MAG TPA: four helix bundle protein [Chryseosolibacter sp.]|nr:four helix bundle protein [Chryseosolibacter sp.]
MKSYRDLEIYTMSKNLALEVHKLSLELPAFELYEEGSQVRRSSKAVTSSIIEGYGRRRYKADFIRYLTFSICEWDETILHLEFLVETGSAKETERVAQLIDRYDLLSKKINKFLQWVENCLLATNENPR